jgi:hypothetical protein
MDLPKRVSELKKEGILLKKKWKVAKNRYGDKVRFIAYSLK